MQSNSESQTHELKMKELMETSILLKITSEYTVPHLFLDRNKNVRENSLLKFNLNLK